MKIADYYEKLDKNVVSCFLCPHCCVIKEGKSGICEARKNIQGDLYSLNYGVVSGLSFDPIEKKPLYHYFPGSEILSVGTVGCNLHCPFCQNYNLSRYFEEPEGQFPKAEYKPEYFLELLKAHSGKNSFAGIAYTYSEPVVWLEFVLETAKLMKKEGFKNVLVSNGYINLEPLSGILPYIDAANIDLKAFTEEHYRKLGGKLAQVLESITAMVRAGVHIELTTLVVTDFNDNMEELEALVRWVSDLNKKIPLHFSRYFPKYKYLKPATNGQFLQKVAETAGKYLDYVYLGNTDHDSSSYCPECGNLLIERTGYRTSIKGINDGNCSSCGSHADFVMNGRV